MRGERPRHQERLLGDGREPVDLRPFQRPHGPTPGNPHHREQQPLLRGVRRHVRGSSDRCGRGRPVARRESGPDVAGPEAGPSRVTARKNDPDNAGWQEGARKYGSASASDRYHFNREYGVRDGRRRGRGRPGEEMDNGAPASGVERVVRRYWHDNPSAPTAVARLR